MGYVREYYSKKARIQREEDEKQQQKQSAQPVKAGGQTTKKPDNTKHTTVASKNNTYGTTRSVRDYYADKAAVAREAEKKQQTTTHTDTSRNATEDDDQSLWERLKEAAAFATRHVYGNDQERDPVTSPKAPSMAGSPSFSDGTRTERGSGFTTSKDLDQMKEQLDALKGRQSELNRLIAGTMHMGDTVQRDKYREELDSVNQKISALTEAWEAERPVYTNETATQKQEAVTNAEAALGTKLESGKTYEEELSARQANLQTYEQDLNARQTNLLELEQELKRLEAAFENSPSETVAAQYNAYADLYNKAAEEYNALYGEYKGLFDEYKGLGDEYNGLIDTYKTAYDDYSSYMTHAKSDASGWEIAGNTVMAGLGSVARGIGATVDFVLPAELWDEKDPVSKFINSQAEEAQYYNDKWQESIYGRGAAVEGAAELGHATVAAIPNAILAMMTYGTSMAGQTTAGLTSLAASAGRSGIASTIGTVANNMAKSPMYWSSMAQTLGPAYEEAKEKGANEWQASAAALISSMLNAGVEVSGGIELLPAKVKSGNRSSILEWVLSSPEEGVEEVIQRFISGGTDKAIFDYDKPIYSTTDPEAIINPLEMGKEFAIGTGVGGVLGGAQIGAISAANAGINRVNNKRLTNVGSQYQQMDADVAQALVEDGLSYDKDTEAYKVAEEIKGKLDAGESVTEKDLGRMVVANEQAKAREERLAQANTPRNTTESRDSEALSEVSGKDDNLPARNENAAEAAPETESDPLLEAAREAVGAETPKSVPYNVMATDNPVRQARLAKAKSVQEITGYGEHGASAFTSIVEDTGMDPGRVQLEFQSAYEAGRAGLAQGVARLDSSVRQEAYNAGRLDRIMREKQDVARGATVWGKDGGLVHNDYSAKLDKKTADTLQRIGRATGTKIIMDASLIGTDSNGYYKNGELHISPDAENPVMQVVRHELTHHMQVAAPAEYSKFRDYAVQMVSSSSWETYGSNTAVETMRRKYKQASEGRVDLDVGDAMDEIAAHVAERILTDEKALSDFVNHVTTSKDSATRRMGEKFFQAVREFISKVKRLFKGDKAKMDRAARSEFGATIEQLERAEQLWKEAYRAAENEANKPGRAAESRGKIGTQYSVKEDGGYDAEGSRENRKAFIERNERRGWKTQTYGETAVAFVPVTRAEAGGIADGIRGELSEIGIRSFFHGGLQANFDGTTHTLTGEAHTIPGHIVGINARTTKNVKEVAGHEAFHYWLESRAEFEKILTANIQDYTPETIMFMAETVLLYEENGHIDHALLHEEFRARIAGMLHANKRTAGLRKMLRDYDAVKAAWDNLAAQNASTAITEGPEAGVQYSLVTDKKTLDFLNNQERVKVYRAMYQDHTGLYPPMGSIQGGKRVEPVKFKTWYQADENPQLIKFEVPKRFLAGELNNKGKPRKTDRFMTPEEIEANRDVLYGSHKPNDTITLASGNTLKFKDLKPKFELQKADGGTDVPAAYNPYFHTSLSALNDQFSTAYKRPGLVVVEGYIPKSELSSGYRAQYAKDSVGETTWKSGVVAKELKGEKARKVFLSRWFQAGRVVPDAEAAKMIAGVLEGEDLKVPWNVVTPALREALEAAGVDINYDTVYAGTSFEKAQREAGEQYSLKAPTFYSKMEREIEAVKQKKLGAASVVSMLRGKGVKAEEIKWSGIETFLEGKKSVTKQELLEFARANRLEIQEQELGETMDYTEEQEERLRELSEEADELLENADILWEKLFGVNLPPDFIESSNKVDRVDRKINAKNLSHNEDAQELRRIARDWEMNDYWTQYVADEAKKEGAQTAKWGDYKLEGGENYREYLYKMPDRDYSNSSMRTHWGSDAAGILAHARVQDFEHDGQPVLFVEEIQSDWHNAGQKFGYKQAGKDYVKEIADLDRQIDEAEKLRDNIEWPEADDPNYDDVFFAAMDESALLNEHISELFQQRTLLKKQSRETVSDAPYAKTYHEFVLKNLLRKAAEGGYDWLAWTTGELQEERWSSEFAEGYRIEYDQDIPKFLNKYGKQWGARTEDITLDGLRNMHVHAIPVTEAMKQSVLYEGQPQFSLKDSEFEDAVNQSMTMAQAKDMIQRAFVLGEIKEWFEGEYRNGDEWLKGEGVDAVAMVIDNEWQLQEKYLNKIQGLMDEDFVTTDILEAYLAGTLTGKVKDTKPKRLNVADGVAAQDNRFYAPHEIENAKAAFETASQKVTNKNRDAVYKARADVIMFAHTRGAAEALGLTQSEMNKKLRTWARYNARAKETSDRFNAGVADWNKWTGIENSNILSRITVGKDELDSLVGDITGDSDGHQRTYIVRTMLALDTHIDYSGLNFEFVGRPDSKNSNVNGQYLDSARRIRVKYNAPHTVAHEMGHFLDYQWARDIGVAGALTDGFGRDRLDDPDAKQWAANFDKFKDSLTDSSDIHSGYSMDAKEVFARFVDKFVQWVNFTANGEQALTYYYNDKFTAQHYIEFVRLLQEKSMLDGKKQQGTRFSLKNLDDIKAEHKDKTDHLYLHERRDGTISIDNMVVKKEYRNQGIGTQILNDVIAYADETGKTITLTPTTEFGTKAKLTRWYKANGFVENKGRNADYRLSDTMYRLPRNGAKFSLKGLNDLLDENAKLQKVHTALQEQFAVTTFEKSDKKALDQFAKGLLKDWKSGADINETREALSEFYTFVRETVKGEDPDFAQLEKRAYEVALPIIQNVVEVDDAEFQQYKDLRNHIKRTGITFDKAYEKDLGEYESLNEFRKAYFGKIRLVNDGLPINSFYQELSSMYPGLFDESIHDDPADQLLHIAQVLDELQPTEVNPYSHNMREATTWLATDIIQRIYDLPQAKPTFGDKLKGKVPKAVTTGLDEMGGLLEQQRTKLEQADAESRRARRELAAAKATGNSLITSNRQLKRELDAMKAENAKIIEESRQKVKDTITGQRMAAGREIEKLKRKQREKDAKKSESQKAREMRAKILRHTSELSKKLLRASDRNHISQDLQGAVAKLLESINLESNYAYDSQSDGYKKNDLGSPTLRTRLARQLQKMYGDMANELTIDPDLLGDDGLLAEVIGMADTRLVDMTLAELETVWKAIRAIEASVMSANIAFNQSRWATIGEWAEALRQDNAGKKDKVELDGPFGLLGWGQRLTGLQMMTPEAYFHRLGKAGDGLFRMLRNAQDDHIRKMKAVSDFTHEALKGVDVRKLESKMHKVKLGGQEVQLSTAQIMELYVLLNREQAREHIMVGGILPDVVSKGGIKKVARAKPVRGVQMSELLAAFRLLSEQEIQIAKKLQDYASTQLSKWGNEASMKVYNYEKFGEKTYWPIRVNRQETQSNVQKDTQVTSVAGWGFTKGTKPHANNSVMIGSIFDTFSTHASEMATYAAYLAPMEDINRIRNYTFKSAGVTTDTVKGIIDTVHGKGGTAYLSKLLADLSIGVKGTHDTDMMSALAGNYKAASVGANLRVIIQQPTALLRALDMLGPQYMAAGMRPSNGWKKAKKYAPIAQWKDWGYFDINTGRQMKDVLFDSDSVLNKVKSASMWGAGAADSLSWGLLWNAVETETKHKRKDMKAGTEEFYQAVAERFTEIVDHTQVVDGILQRSQIMRSADGLTKMATSFMGEPTKQYNMMMSAAYDATHGNRETRRAGKRRFMRSSVTLLIAGVANAAAQSLMDALRDDDKEKEYWEKWLAAYTGLTGEEETLGEAAKNAILEGNLGSTFNPISYLPYVKDALSLIQGYDVTRMDMESIEKTLGAAQNMLKALSGEGKYTIGGASANLFAEVARMAGVSVSNLKRDVKAIAMTAAIETDNYLLQYRMEKASLDLNYSGNSSTFLDILFNAYQNDREAYDIIYEDMIASGYDPEKLANGMESRMKKAEDVKSVDDLEQRFLHPDQEPEYNRTMNEIRNSGLWYDATEDQQKKLEERLYDLVTDSKTGQEMQEKIDEGAAYGLDETEFLLYKLALDMYDQPNKSGEYGGTPTNEEKATAIASLGGLSDGEIAFLWDTKQGYELYEHGIDMQSYVDYVGAGGSVSADKLMDIVDQGIAEETYYDFLDMLKEVDEPTKSGKMGSFTQKEATAAVAALPGLSNAERAALWQSVNSSWKKNPWR